MSNLNQTSNEIRISRLLLHELGGTLQEYNSHSYSILSLGERWRRLQDSFVTVHDSLEDRVKIIESKEREFEMIGCRLQNFEKEVEVRRKKLDFEEKEMSERVERMELREKEVREWCESLKLDKRVVLERSKAVEVKEQCIRAVEERERKVEERLRAVEEREREVELREEERMKREDALDMREKELKEKEEKLEEDRKEVELKEEAFKEQQIKKCMGKLEAREKRIEEREQDMVLKDNEMDLRLRWLEISENDVNKQCLAVEVKEKRLCKLSDALELKERELGEQCQVLKLKEKQVNECYQGLALKEKQLNEGREALDSKEKKLNKGLKALEFKEKRINEMEERFQAVESKERQMNEQQEVLKLKEKQFKENCEKLELKEKEMDDRCQVIELREKEVDEVCQAAAFKEKQVNEIREALDFKDEIFEHSQALETKDYEFTKIPQTLVLAKKQSNLRKGRNLEGKELNERSQVSELAGKQSNEPCQPEELNEKQSDEDWILSRCRTQEHKLKQVVCSSLTQVSQELPLSDIPQEVCAIDYSSLNGGEIHSLCANMDANGLRSYLIEQEKYISSEVVLDALKSASNPGKLVLNVCQSFHHKFPKNKSLTVANKNSCIFVLEQFMKLSTPITYDVKVEATKFADVLNPWLNGNHSPQSNFGFLQFLAAFDLAGLYNADKLLSLFKTFYGGSIEVYRQEQHVYLCQALGLSEKIPDVIKSLIERKKWLMAVQYICVFKKECDFPPVPLLEAHLEFLRKRVDEKRENGTSESKTQAKFLELNYLRNVIKCIEMFKLESKFQPDSLLSRIKELEKAKKERRHAALKPMKKRSARSRTSVTSPVQLEKRPRVENVHPATPLNMVPCPQLVPHPFVHTTHNSANIQPAWQQGPMPGFNGLSAGVVPQLQPGFSAPPGMYQPHAPPPFHYSWGVRPISFPDSKP